MKQKQPRHDWQYKEKSAIYKRCSVCGITKRTKVVLSQNSVSVIDTRTHYSNNGRTNWVNNELICKPSQDNNQQY